MSSVPSPQTGGMTRQQHALLAYIRGFIETHGYPPSFREMAGGLGLNSMSRVHALLHGLEARGHVSMLPGQPRSLTILTDELGPAITVRVKPVRTRGQEVVIMLPRKVRKELFSLARRARIGTDEIIVQALVDYIMEQPADAVAARL